MSSSNLSTHIPDLVLANPNAGGGLGQKALLRLQKFAAEKRWNVEFRSPESPEEFTRMARLEAAGGRERIFALGGDGTFQVLLNAVAENQRISIGVLPAGGGNDLASALRLPLDPVQAAEAILLRGEVSCFDAARVRTGDGTERLYMGGGGVGLDAEAARFASGAYGMMRGKSRYLLSLIRALGKFQPVRARLFLQGPAEGFLEAEALVVGVLNTPSYGAGLRLAPDAQLQDGKLDLVVVEKLKTLEILKALTQLIVSGEVHSPRIHKHLIQRARIETDRPCLFHADGEIIGQTPVEIAALPKAMRVWHLPRSPNTTALG